MSFLETIVASKRVEIADKKRSAPCSYLQALPKYKRKTLPLAAALRGQDLALIATIRRTSSPVGLLGGVFDPLTMADEYVRLGARALSVPSDEKFLLGRLEYIEQISDVNSVPLLSRDFVIDPYQIHEAKAHGADALLLMASVLEPGQIADFAGLAASLGLESVVEVHSENELEALDWSVIQSVCINNRDVFSFETDVYTCTRLKKQIPLEKVVIAEGGISTTNDVDLLLNNGIHVLMIGEPFGTGESSVMVFAELVRYVATKGRGAHIGHLRE